MAARDRGVASPKLQYAIVELDRLRPHEATEEPLIAETAESIRKDGFLRRPLLVESRHLVILDGHHRYEALKRLGCSRAAVYLVDYEDDGIGLTTWPGAKVDVVSKEDVIDRGLRNDPFPPKTTRHIVPELDEVRVPLNELL